MYGSWNRNNESKRRRRRLIAIGDLDKKITIQKRVLSSQFQNGLSDMETFTDYKKPWACIETVKGAVKFDGIEIKRGWTHEIFIRFMDGLDKTFWILWGNRRFKIIEIENLDERNEFLRLKVSETGTSDSTNKGAEG